MGTGEGRGGVTGGGGGRRRDGETGVGVRREGGGEGTFLDRIWSLMADDI